MIGAPCKECGCILTKQNAAKKNKKYFRNICKPCRSKEVTKYNTGNEKRKKYMRAYARRKGIVKEYPCETCGEKCYKRYAKAFCSDKCRFMYYVDVSDGCWIWKGSTNRSGYGRTTFGKRKNIGAHRVSFLLFNGKIPKGMCVCHSCDVPSCVKPAHLWLGITQQNTEDMVKKGRSLYGEKHSKSKLCFNDILIIRHLNTLKKWTQKKIAEMFNITPGHVNNIIKNRVWLNNVVKEE